MEKFKQRGKILFLLCVMLFGSLMINTEVCAKNSNSWKRAIDDSSAGDKPVKRGNYYFKYKNGKIYISKNKNSGYTATPITYDAYTNGKIAYYTNKNVLYKYTFSSKKTTTMKKLPVKKDYDFDISMVYGNQIFLTKGSFDDWTYWTYQYNTKTKKLKNLKKDCALAANYGKYVVSYDDYRTDVSPTSVTLYKITSSGLKKVKKLADRGFNGQFVKGKLYYTVYSGDYMKQMTLYRCNANGSNAKKLGTISSSTEYGQVIVQEFQEKKCIVYKDDARYEYTYSTGKLKKIK